MEKKNCKVYVGFGGSGLKSLVQLARLFADDQAWNVRCKSEVYFLLVDTDLGELDDAERDIEQAMTRAGANAYVGKVQLSEGVVSMQRLITDNLALKHRKAEEQIRLKDAWWHDADGHPFTASSVLLPPSAGASQCPAISYFLAWNACGGQDSTIGRAIGKLHEAMQGRIAQAGFTDMHPEVRLYIVAGLAGGTGRGCWWLLSLKIRELFERHNHAVMPIGVFFDYSCSRDIAEGNASQRVKMMVNSLTGISEIVAWLDNDRDRNRAKRYRFSLPSFQDPANPDTDCVNTDILVTDPLHSGATPVSQAFLIFQISQAGRLKEHGQYTIAAAALYARAAYSDVESLASNDPPRLGSLSASVYRVDVESIRDFLTKRLEHDAADQFAKSDTTAAEAIVDAILLPLKPVMGRDKEASGCPATAAWNEPHVLARINEVIASATKSRVIAFIDTLVTCSQNEWSSEIKKLSSFESAPLRKELEQGVVKALLASITHVWPNYQPPAAAKTEEFLLQYFQTCMKSQMRGLDGSPLRGHLDSIAVAQEVLEGVRLGCGQISDLLSNTQPNRTVSLLSDEIKKRATGFLGMKSKLTETEQTELGGEAAAYVREVGRKVVGGMLANWIEPAKTHLSAWQYNLQYATDRAARHASDIDNVNGEDRQSSIFTIDDELKKYSKNNIHVHNHAPERLLEPACNPKILKGWMQELRMQSDPRFKEAVDAIRNYVLDNAYTTVNGGRVSEDEVKKHKRELTSLWETAGKSVFISQKFLHTHFRFAAVATKLVAVWSKDLDALCANPAEQNRLMSQFEACFGFTMQLDAKRMCVHLEPKQIVQQMAQRIGRNCRAQMIVTNPVGKKVKEVRSLVFLPSDEHLVKGKTQVAHWVNELNEEARRHDLPTTYLCTAEDTDGTNVSGNANPFMVLAVVHEFVPMQMEHNDREVPEGTFDLDRIKALDYWTAVGDPDLHQQLQDVEDIDGKSMFAPPSYSFGLGYVTPDFVRNPLIRDRRWRPWTQFRDAADKRKETAGYDSLVYALLGSDGGDSAFLHLKAEDEGGTESDWTLPLLRYGESTEAKNAFTFTRVAFTDTFGGWAAKSEAFKKGKSFTSIKKLMEHFDSDMHAIPAIRKEAAHYFGVLCVGEGFADSHMKKLFLALREWIHTTVRDNVDNLPNFKEDYEVHVLKIEERALALSLMTRGELAKHFKV